MANKQKPQVTTTTKKDNEEIIRLRSEEIIRLRDEIVRLRETLAQISTEIGLPPTMGPAPGELRRILGEGQATIAKLQEAPRGISADADFEAMTWTFLIGPECKTGSGTYALVWMPQDKLAAPSQVSDVAKLDHPHTPLSPREP